ncbi:MAG: tetratricopeptide repeat protein [Nitrospinota bacterium]
MPLLLIAATLAVFRPTINYGFVWDDSLLIINNPYLIPPTLKGLIHFWTEPQWLFMPLSYSVWALLAWLSLVTGGEINPQFFHAANLAVHLMTVLVIFSILKMIIGRSFTNTGVNNDSPDDFRTELTAAAGALIFAIHPVMVEPVAWSSDLKDLLCGLFSFLAVREYLAFAYASKYEGKYSRKYMHYVLASIVFLLALFSKATAVVVPIVVFILDRWIVRRGIKQSGFSLVGWIIVAAFFGIIAKSVQQSDAAIVTAPLWARPLVAADALAFYIYKLALPLELGIDYGRKPNYVTQQWWIYVTWLLPFAFAIAMWFSKKRAMLSVAFGIFIAALLPVLGFIPFLFQNHSTVADHYLYIPMLGVSLFASSILYASRSKPVVLTLAVFILFLGARSSYQVPVWKNNISLYEHALKINPFSATAHINIGMAYEKIGRMDKAAYHYKKSIRFRPNYFKAHNNLGVVLKTQGKLDEAADQYIIALKIKPEIAEIYGNLGVVLALQGKTDEAITQFEKALKIKPSLAPTHYMFGLLLARQGLLEEAATHYSQALKLNPGLHDAKRQLQKTEAQLTKRKNRLFQNHKESMELN